MEVLQEYRHVVDKETKKIFIDSLKKVIKEIDLVNIGFIGVVDSDKEYSHDIDLLIFPSKTARIGATLFTIMELYKKLEREIKKHHKRFYLSLAPKKTMQEMIYYLSSLEEGGSGLIPVHTLFFTNYNSFKKLNPLSFQREIKKNLVTIYGEFDIIKELPKLSQNILEIYYMIIEFEMMSRIKTFPKHLVRASAESLFGWIKRKDDILTKFGIEVKKNLHDFD